MTHEEFYKDLKEVRTSEDDNGKLRITIFRNEKYDAEVHSIRKRKAYHWGRCYDYFVYKDVFYESFKRFAEAYEREKEVKAYEKRIEI